MKLLMGTLVLIFATSLHAQTFSSMLDGLETGTYDYYPTKGPKWVKKIMDMAEDHQEGITKVYDEHENAYDAVLGCVEDLGFTMEDFEYDEVIIDYKIFAVKNYKQMKAYKAKKRKSRPKTVAYAIKPIVEISYSVNGHSGICNAGSEVEYYIFTNDSKSPKHLGTVYDSDEQACDGKSHK